MIKCFRGLSANVNGEIRRTKAELLTSLDKLELLQEERELEQEEWDQWWFTKQALDEIDKCEEIQAFQRAKLKWLKEGDQNQRYFHQVVRDRRSHLVAALEIDGEMCIDKAQIKRNVVEFSRNLLETEGWRWCHDRDNFGTPEEQVTREENELLCRPISVEEVKEAINQIWADIAPGPDGFSMSFYQGCWGIIEQHFMKQVRGSQAGTLNVAKINQAAICLVPKSSNPKNS